MYHVEVSRVIRKPAQYLWQILDNFGAVSAYHPHVKHSEIINQTQTGNGAERTCLFENGNRIKERIISYDPGSAYEVDIYDAGSFPLKKAVAKLAIKPLSENSSQVFFTMSFLPKFGLLGTIMANFMMKKQFARILNSVLQGLEKYSISGETITVKNLENEAA